MATLTGTDNQDVLNGGIDDDLLLGLRGDDFLYGRGGNDLIGGGRGGDVLIGGNGDDTLIGGRGDDTLGDDAGSGVIIGGAGNDTISNQRSGLHDESRIRVDAGSGDDKVWADSVSERFSSHIDLGSGDDLLLMYANKGRVVVDLGTGHDTIMVASRYGAGDGPVMVLNFGAGDGGDLVDLTSPSALTDGGLIGYDGGDLFELGFARLTETKRGVRFEVDVDGGGDRFHTVLFLKGVEAAALSGENFSGYDPHGVVI